MAIRRTGQIIKRGENKHLVRIFIGTNEATGKRIYHNHTVRGIKKDAEKYLTSKLRELDLGSYTEPTKKTVGECFDTWIKNVRHSITEKTADGYAGLFNRNLRPELGEVRLTSLQADDIQSVYAGMIKRGLSAMSVKHTHVVLNAILEDAVAKGLISQNRASLVNLPRIQYVERRVLTEDEAVKFLAACNEHPEGLVFEFAVMTGMRPQEFLALKWSDIDFDRKSAMILRALERHKGMVVFKDVKTAKGRRLIPLALPLVERLRRHKRLQNEKRLKAGSLWEANDLVFCTEIGTALNQANLTYRYYRPILESADLPQMRMYDLRHSHATLLLVLEQNPKIVSERLGHSTIRLTLDTYSHVLPTMQREATDKLEGMLYKKPA